MFFRFGFTGDACLWIPTPSTCGRQMVAGTCKFVVARGLFRNQISGQAPPADASLSLAFRSLQDADHVARLDAFASEEAARAAGGEVYQALLAVNGQWDKPPSHAVCAIWELGDPKHAAAFAESRRQLFTLRQQVLPTFAADWLLKHHNQENRFMVVGFYGDEEGALRLCREHPKIKEFAAAHPASDYGAVDLTGLLCWQIEEFGPA